MTNSENQFPVTTRVVVTPPATLGFVSHLAGSGVVTNAPRMVGPNTSCAVRLDGEKSSRVIPVGWLSR